MPPFRQRAVDGAMHFLGTTLADYARSGPLATMAARRGVTIPPTTDVADVDPIPAILEEDRWVALCPDCRRNAQLVWLEEPLYCCGNCFNVAVGGRWRPVALPEGRARIEEITGYRRFSHERNWRGEPLSDLLVENRDNGIPTPLAD